MKQTLVLRDNYSNKMHEELHASANLRGEVEIQERDLSTGNVKTLQRHNLIVYGGREWLLRRVFGSKIDDNTGANNSIIKWVGVGVGGGEPGNPLQCGSTVGSDNDLYTPVRIRYSTPDNQEYPLNFASRILSSGDCQYGYYKQISNIEIKEDHANPYVKYGVTHYPNIIAEIRIELSSNDCNGNENVYQDINEAALFISDQDIDDPGIVDNITKKTTVLQGTNRVSIAGDTLYSGVINSVDKTISFSGLVSCYYNLQMLLPDDGSVWTTVSEFRNMLVTTPTYSITNENLDTDGQVRYRLISLPSVKLTWTLDFTTNHTNVQYRILEDIYDTWSTLISINNIPLAQSPYVHYVNCADELNPLLNADTTEFRVAVRSELDQASLVSRVEPLSDSYNVKYYVSNDDIDFIKVGDSMYVTGTGEYLNNVNLVSDDSPYTVSDKFKGNNVNQSYVLVTKEESSELDIVPELGTMTAYFIHHDVRPYTMFSRCTFSTIRKTIDREIVLLWKLYF